MKVLLLAPQPFYVERGTPIAVDLLVSTLSQQGHSVDLMTFPGGEPRHYPNVRHFLVGTTLTQAPLKAGFTPMKLVLDFLLFWRVLWRVLWHRYDVVHAVEESAFIAMVLAPLFRFRYVYDMDSSMAGQIGDKLPPKMQSLTPLLERIESLPMRYADAVVPVCEALAEPVRKIRSEGLFLLKDVSLADKSAEPSGVVDVRATTGADASVFMYIGNLESYQGIDLMLAAFALVAPQNASAQLVIVGGSEAAIANYRRWVEQHQLDARIHFLGPQPVSHLLALMRQADVLMSPRIHGVNTPMKVYSYMDSGVAVLATNLSTHTQCMDATTAELVAPEPEAMAAGMLALLASPERRADLARHAEAYIAREHSVASFRRRVIEIYDYLALRNGAAV